MAVAGDRGSQLAAGSWQRRKKAHGAGRTTGYMTKDLLRSAFPRHHIPPTHSAERCRPPGSAVSSQQSVRSPQAPRVAVRLVCKNAEHPPAASPCNSSHVVKHGGGEAEDTEGNGLANPHPEHDGTCAFPESGHALLSRN